MRITRDIVKWTQSQVIPEYLYCFIFAELGDGGSRTMSTAELSDAESTQRKRRWHSSCGRLPSCRLTWSTVRSPHAGHSPHPLSATRPYIALSPSFHSYAAIYEIYEVLRVVVLTWRSRLTRVRVPSHLFNHRARLSFFRLCLRKGRIVQ